MSELLQSPGVVIVGAGQAGGEVAVALRQGGYQQPIILLGQEAHVPYRRPPLSKEYLAGKATREQLYVKPAEAYERLGIDIRLNHCVTEVDRAARQVRLEDGQTIDYDKLVLATGGRPRRLDLPGAELPCIRYIRTLDDIDSLRAGFRSGARLVIVGGGFIGLETAAVAIKHGLQVSVVEAAPRLLERVAAVELSAFYQRLHESRGVRVLTGTQVQGFEAAGNGCRVLTNVAALDADLVVVGVGLLANVELAKAAGLEVDTAISTDALARTSDEHILAVGDCASHPSEFYGQRLRLESIQNALEQARTAAATLLGEEKPYNPVPWFWSDQYELKLQMVGLSQGYQQTAIRGEMDSLSFSVFYLRDGRIISVDTVNRPQDFLLGKRLVAARASASAAQLRDPEFSLKSLL